MLAVTGEALNEEDKQIVRTIRDFVNREVVPMAPEMDREDRYPWGLVERIKEMGLFGAIIPEEFGGLGLSFTSYAHIVEEIARGWMSLVGVFNTHLIMAHIVAAFGTPEQKARLLPPMARGEKRGGLALTEPDAGSDVQNMSTFARRENGRYLLNGTKMFLTNGRHGNTFALLAKTSREAQPPYRGLSCFIAEKGPPGFVVGRDLDKLGYKGIDTCEVFLEDFPILEENLVGGREGEGFLQVVKGLEAGRINVAARAVGVARAAFEAAIRYSQQRHTFGQPICNHQAIQLMLADMATKIEAAHLLTMSAAAQKDRGEEVATAASMAKLFASESCWQVVADAMRILGGYGYIKDFPVERFYRDAPLMVLGEGTNEIQKLLIAKNLLKQFPV